MTEPLDGFTRETFSFLQDLSHHNDKAWFEQHKSTYLEQVLKPLQALVTELGSFMLRVDSEFEIAPTVNKTISRIYRDTRFSKDKSPFKTSLWITFKRPRKDWQNHPAFFFEISPNSYRYGMGFFSADRETMDGFRHRLDSHPASFVAATAFYRTQGDFVIEGEQYKRPLKADIPTELLDWYNRKSFYLTCNQMVAEKGIDKHLIADLMRGFDTLAPLYHYLCGAPNPAG